MFLTLKRLYFFKCSSRPNALVISNGIHRISIARLMIPAKNKKSPHEGLAMAELSSAHLRRAQLDSMVPGAGIARSSPRAGPRTPQRGDAAEILKTLAIPHLWWAGRESNPHGFHHRILSPARLPITPPAHPRCGTCIPFHYHGTKDCVPYKLFLERAASGEPRSISPLRGGWSGRRGSNPRPLPWQGSVLPLNYSRVKR